jgi:hypothetical protein
MNIEEFERFQQVTGKIDSHGALKHLQALSGVECDESRLEVPGLGPMLVRTPISLAFDEMDQPRFNAAYAGFCDYLKRRWFEGMEQWQIEEMANLVGTEA